MVHTCIKATSKNYSSKEDELKVMPILVRYFVTTSTTSTTFATWCGVNSWQCSSVSRIASATKASFVVPWNLTQKKQKDKNKIRFQC
jgi:hypothetical protein